MHLEIPPTVQTIGEEAFCGCAALKTLTCPHDAQLGEIGRMAFARTGLELFIAPGSLRMLGDGAFAECASLQRVALNQGLQAVGGAPDIKSGEEEARIGVFEASGVSRVIFPTTLVVLGPRAFRGCRSLREVRRMPNTQVLSDECFAGCGLTAVEVPASVVSVGERAFADCANLEKVTFEPGAALECVDNTAFAGTRVDVGALPDFVREKICVDYSEE